MSRYATSGWVTAFGLTHPTLLLERYRDTQLSEAERLLWLDPMLRSINAVAAGMRNTG